MTDCVFCSYKDTYKDKIILENDFCFLVGFFEGVPNGSGMIMLKSHRETVFDLTLDEWNATYDLLNQAKKLIDKKGSVE